MKNSLAPWPLRDVLKRRVIPEIVSRIAAERSELRSRPDSDGTEVAPRRPKREELITSEALTVLKKFREYLLSRAIIEGLGAAAAAELLTGLLGRPVYADMKGLRRPEIESVIQKSGGSRLERTARYRNRVLGPSRTPFLGEGRVLLDDSWMQKFLKNPRALYVLLDALDDFRREGGYGDPFIAVLAGESLYDDIRNALTNKAAGLGLGVMEKMAIMHPDGLLSRLPKLIEVVDRGPGGTGVPAEAMNGYIQSHDYGVAVLLGEEIEDHVRLLAEAQFVLAPGEVHPNDIQAVALLVPELLKAAELIRGIGDPLKQREILERQLPLVLPGVAPGARAFVIRLVQYVEELKAQKAVEIMA